jgi:hypothetical protein
MGGGYTAEFRPASKVQPRDQQIKQVEEWLGCQVPGRCLSSDVYGVWVVGDLPRSRRGPDCLSSTASEAAELLLLGAIGGGEERPWISLSLETSGHHCDRG